MIQINEVFKSDGDSFLSSVTKMLNCIFKRKTNTRKLGKWENIKQLLWDLFDKHFISKIFEKIVYSRMYNNISNYISPFQAGSQKNQGTNDMFLLRGAIDHSLYTNSPLTIIFYDFQDSFKTACYANGMLTYKMNCFI